MSDPSCRVTRKVNFGRLLERQARALLFKGFDRESSLGSDEFICQLEELSVLLDKIGDVTEKQIPFLIVVPRAIVPISRQMALLSFVDSEGRTELEDEGFRSQYLGVDSGKLYLAHQITSASNFSGTAFDFSRQVIESGEYGLTAEEGVALALQMPLMLLRAPLDLVGSRYSQSNLVPYLLNQSSKGPRLLAKDGKIEDAEPHVFPKCVGRLNIS